MTIQAAATVQEDATVQAGATVQEGATVQAGAAVQRGATSLAGNGEDRQEVEMIKKLGQAERPLQDAGVEREQTSFSEDASMNRNAEQIHGGVEIEADGNACANNPSHPDVEMEPDDFDEDDDLDKDNRNKDEDHSKEIDDDRIIDKGSTPSEDGGTGGDVDNGKGSGSKDEGRDNSKGSGNDKNNAVPKSSKRKRQDVDYTETAVRSKKPRAKKSTADNSDITRATGKGKESRRWLRLEEDIFVSVSGLS